MSNTILITGETPSIVDNPSQHPEFRKQYPKLFAPLQTEAYRRVRQGQSCALVAPTSSGKTLAVAAPLFEVRRPAVFVLPFRALILDQSQELVRIATTFGIPETAFARVWGGTTKHEVAEAVKRDYILITPDKLISFFIAGRDGHAAAINILNRYDFVFDEVHIYNAMMLTSLKYFLRSVRYWQEVRRQKSGFYFLSATFPQETWELLQEELGLTDDDRIEGVSYTGNVELLVKPFRTVTKATDGSVPIAQDMQAWQLTQNTVGIFNSAHRAWVVCQALGGLLFIGQDKMQERIRRDNFERFKTNPDQYTLIGSPAIEAGVDFTAGNSVIEESYQDSFVQRFGRTARSGQDAFVLAYSNSLHRELEQGNLKSQYTRAEFLAKLQEITQLRQSRKLFTGLAAYAYYNFWDNDPDFPMTAQDRKLCERLKRKGVDSLLAFRSLTPYFRYESGESIGFKALFQKKLPVEKQKVLGAPDPKRYYFSPKRSPVFAEIVRDEDIAEKEELENGNILILAQVYFHQNMGTHWVLLELTKHPDADDDNIRLLVGAKPFGRRQDGGMSDTKVRFYDLDI